MREGGAVPDGFDAAAFARVALPHLDAAYTLARWLLRDGDAAQDVVQDAMVKAMTYFHGYRGGNAHRKRTVGTQTCAKALEPETSRHGHFPLPYE